MQSERFRIWVGFLIISTVWGSTWLAIKLGLQSMPPFFAAGIRFVVASSILYAIIRVRGLSIPFTAEARRIYLTLGILTFSIPFALVYWGQQFIPSALSSILFGAYPFWVALFSHLMLRNERLDIFKLAGIVLGFAGILVIFWNDLQLSESSALLGMGAIIVSTLLQAYSLVVIKKHGEAINPFVMNFVGMSMGAVVLLTLSLVSESNAHMIWDLTAVGSILYLSVVGSVLTFVSYYWLLKRIEVVYLSLTSFINPVVAVVLGALVLDEALSPSVLVGAAFVLTGILVANGRYFYERGRAVA